MPLIKLLTRCSFGRVNKWNVTLLRLSILLMMSVSSIALGDYDPAPFLSWIEETKTSVDIPGVAVAIVSRDEVLHLETWVGDRSIKNRLSPRIHFLESLRCRRRSLVLPRP